MRVAALLLLVACGRVDFGARLDDAGGSAGTRLKQEYDVYDGTLKMPARIYDSLLGADCYAYPTSAGTRCLSGTGTLAYLDAACTQPVAAKTSSSPYAFDASASPVAHVYTYGASVGMPATIYTAQYDGSCAATMPTSELFALTEVGFDAFAQLTRTYGSEGRLVSSTLVADDGFRTPGLLHDTQVDADCLGEAFDDRTVCFVEPTDVAYFYLDSACTQVADDAYTTVQFSQHLTTLPPCRTTDFEVRPLGAELPRTTPLWVQIPGDTSCIPTAVGASRRLFSLGAPITLASVTRQPVPGGRMQAIESTASGARGDDPFTVWDSQLGVECAPQIAADGVRRCLPGRIYAQHAGYFTDAGCTQPIVGAGVQSPGCATQQVTYLLDLEGGSMAHVFQAALRPGTIYGGGPTNCQPYAQTAFYAETTEVPIDMFAVVTQQTDP